jgi:hypothetical protein
MGEWDLTIYDDLSLGRTVGQVYHCLVIIVNLILLLNLVIAILAETYARFSQLKLGLYYDGVVDAISQYKYDKRYGAMITAVPPFNVIMFLFTPIFYCVKNQKKLRAINSCLSHMAYFPIAMILVVVFGICNMALIPFAYFAALFSKTKISLSMRIHRSRKTLLKDLVVFFFLGPIFLFLSQFTDLKHFV